MQKRSRKYGLKTLVPVCIFNIVLLGLLWTQLLTPAQHQSQSGANTRNASGLGDIGSPLIGQAAPDFTLPELNGTSNPAKVRLADFRGKSVVLNFWASWCDPCIQETPFLQKAWPALKAQGIIFIGIDGPEKTSNALKFLQAHTISYLNVQDSTGSTVASSYGVAGFPETIFIDRHGVVVAKWTSPLNRQGLQLEVTKLAH